ncbi:MAG: class I SAM-dependent RNA methyltransferase [Puniceicoccales bacterium]|jgi:23S rRNA (uracil1939-C5)-methyltransferase/tRNA (uracil-5-)-methyltransferase|nr:class I SAM-dependent RNA methyltransferase [Puniceicoccales bacterium]
MPAHPEEGFRKVPKKFNPTPFDYHKEIEVEITTLTNLGDGLGRVDGWVVMVPFALPDERVLARVWHNAANFSRADFVRVLRPSPNRAEPHCPLFGTCGGCQYQNLAYPAQLAWKTRLVAELFQRLAGIADAPVNPCTGSPREYHYRSKITPHFQTPPPDGSPFPIGFLAANQRGRVVDVPQCPIATESINASLPSIRAGVFANRTRYKRGATLLLRDTAEGVVTDPRSAAVELVQISAPFLPSPPPTSPISPTPATSPASPVPVPAAAPSLRLRFPAGDFFQNNPFILPLFADYAVKQALGDGCRFLIDTYCGSGLFALAGARHFEHVLGIEVNADAVRNAAENAAANSISNCRFLAGSAERIFAKIATPPDETAVLMDPPRRGSDAVFLEQLAAFRPRRIVYVSCAPDTQMRDLKTLLAVGYTVADVQPFDLFPQTRHIENIVTLRR